jgi:hypothetical protein
MAPLRQGEISPELVLVMPAEEARQAREQLPRELFRQPARLPAGTRAFVPVDSAVRSTSWYVEHPPLAASPSARAPQPKRRRPLLAFALVVLVAAGAVFVFARAREHKNTGRVQIDAATSVNAPAAPTTGATGLAPSTSAPKVSSPAPKRTAAAATGAHRSPPRSQAVGAGRVNGSSRPRAAPTDHRLGRSRFVPSRLWGWRPQAGARRYLFLLSWNGHVVLRTTTAKAQFVLPSGFRFHAGAYRWLVVSEPRRLRLVDSKFHLSPAAAAAANRR